MFIPHVSYVTNSLYIMKYFFIQNSTLIIDFFPSLNF